MIEVSAALATVLEKCRPGPAEAVPLSAVLLNRILAEPVRSDIDSPPFTKSLMDGYAVRAQDVQGPATLALIEEVAAGRSPSKVVGPGQTIRVMTGAPIPDGADAVVPHEETETAGNSIAFRRTARAGQFVLPRGREMSAGEVVLPTGTVLTAPAIGLLAAVGRTDAPVYRAPRLAIISTGDELVEPAKRPGPGQIRNSNGTMLQALAARGGSIPMYLGIARDDPAVLARLVRDGLESADILVLSGGVSAGKFDFVPEVLANAGVKAHFHKIRMKPGKPLLFGTLGEKLVFGLPGNPVSSFVGFELFVRPALKKRAGHPEVGPAFTPMPLAADLAADNDRPTYAPARLEATAERLCVRPLTWFGSADLRSFHSADALIGLPPGTVNYPVGTNVSTLLLNL